VSCDLLRVHVTPVLLLLATDWHHVAAAAREPVTATRFVARLDQSVTIASSAVLRGGYACVLRKLGHPIESDPGPPCRPLVSACGHTGSPVALFDVLAR